MITRPLDLAHRLRREPRSFDWLFFVNAAAIVLFFSVYGSPFVLAPGLALDFRLPTVAGAEAAAVAPTSFVRVTDSGQIFAGDGVRTLEQLPEWLRAEAKRTSRPVLLVIASDEVRIAFLTEIANAAGQAGFVQVVSAGVEPGTDGVNSK
jgi:biopolymer transport protein ExbD